MENRFTVKDFFLFLLMVALIASVWVGIKQYDRQWDELRSIRTQAASQAKDIHDIQEMLRKGVKVGEGVATTNPTTRKFAKDDPFRRVREMQAMPEYASGGWLVDAFGNTVGNLTPLLAGDWYAYVVQSYVQESLATRDPDTLEWIPLLARSFSTLDNSKAYDAAVALLKAKGKTDEEIAKDPTVPPAMWVTFKMRPGVQFSDGHPLTADDVVFTYNFIMDPAINCPRDKAYLARIQKVEKTADDEVKFTFKEPYFEAFNLAAGMLIMPKHFYGKFKAEEFNQSVGYLLGSGPYRMEDPESWKPGKLIQLVRNERYWGVPSAFDRMIWKEITLDKAHLAAFRNGDIDIFPAQPDQYHEMIADEVLLARTQHMEYQNPLGGYRYIAWNERKNDKTTQFTDKRVRQALTMLIDRQRMIQEVLLGYAVEATGPFSPLSKQCDPEVKSWPYDVKRAKELLKEAGFEDRNGDGIIDDPNGQPFEFKLTYTSGSAVGEKLVLFVRDALARAGIMVKPDPMDWAILEERLKNKNFDAVTLSWSSGIENDIYQMFHSSQMIAGGDDFMSYKSVDLDRVIDQARRTVDENKRIPLWREAHRILHEDQPYSFLFYGKSLVFADKNVKNMKITEHMGLNERTEWFMPVGHQRSAP